MNNTHSFNWPTAHLEAAKFIVHPHTGERVMLTPQEIAARREFLEGSKVRESQFVAIGKDMMEGYAADVAGSEARMSLTAAGTRWREEGGDWSWKPARDKALGERMVTFRGVPKCAAEMRGAA